MAPTSSVSGILFATIAAVFLLAAAPAGAKDFCIDRASTAAVNPDFILRKFKLPKAGKCKPIVGVVNIPGASVVTGAACGSPDGASVSFALSVGFMPGPLGASIPSTGSTLPVNVLLATDDLTGLAFSYDGDTPSGGTAIGAKCKNLLLP